MLAAPATATAQCPKTSLADLEDEVMCPVCGTPLGLATEAPQAKRQRQFVLGLVERCRSKDEIKAALATEFGDDVLAVPKDEGLGLAAYLLPALALVAAGAGIAFASVRWRRARAGGAPSGSGPAPAGEPPPTAADSARLEADLRRYEP